jgi:hypothetical protein
LKQTLGVSALLFFAFAAMFTFSSAAQAQRIDFAFGVSTIDAPGASATSATSTDHSPVSLTGGTYPGFSADFLLFHNLGVGGELYWKASQGTYPFASPPTPYRPLFYDFNAVYSPKLASHTYLEVVGGIGAESIRFYCGLSCINPFSGTNYASSNHFMGDFGGGIKFYPKGGWFIRPEARLYLVNNNLEFSSPRAVRYGISIGYTLR